MKLMIAVPVYNRKKYVEITARSLYECSNIDKTDIRVFNDQSTEFDEDFLRQLFNSKNSKVISREQKYKADSHAYKIMSDFIDSGDDVLFICDSDILLRPDAIGIALWYPVLCDTKKRGLLQDHSK